MSTYPLPTLAFQVTPAGVTAPQASDIVASLQASARGIWGADIYLAEDTKLGQLIGVVAAAINDANQQGVIAANGYSPAYAQGIGLSSMVKINGLSRQGATNSTAIITLVGVAGTMLPSNIVQDANGNLWDLPSDTVIPVSGTVDVTAVCETPGAVSAAPGSISQMYNPVAGWQSATNASAAVVGIAEEDDATLRRQQAASTSMPAQTLLQAILATVANLPGVGRSAIFENQASTTDANGIPPHSISVVTEGGDALAVASAIAAKKSPGTGTYGSTVETVVDPAGLPLDIGFFGLADVQIYAAVTVQPLPGYVSTTGEAIVNALVGFIKALLIGGDVYLAQLYGPASLTGNPLGATFVIASLTIGLSPGSLGSGNISIAFNEAAVCSATNVALTVL